jgi:ribosomal protein S18 acetylase RimI-like enzyme
MPISIADKNDIAAIVSLLNSAYRGERSKAGWTSEADLFNGTKRTDEERIRASMNIPGGLFLKYQNDHDMMTGCVFLQKKNVKLYLGMLSVSPTVQAKGIGKQLLNAAEEHARKMRCTSIFMTVISIREELIAWYERHGYSRTGETLPFPAEENSSTPVRELEMIILEKEIY